jgi:hypothetical protein
MRTGRKSKSIKCTNSEMIARKPDNKPDNKPINGDEMKYLSKCFRIFLIMACLLCLAVPNLYAEGDAGAAKKKDSTGTNPANFTYDFRFITEMAEFKDNGGSQIKHTMELRMPIGRNIANLKGEGEGSPLYDMGKILSSRIRVNYLNVSLNNPGSSETTDISGIADFDARILGIAYASKSVIIAPGLEAFFDTASNENLGSGKTSLAPVVFAVFPGILGGRSIFAPGYQYVFDVGGDDCRADISRSQIDLYFVWILAGGKNWLLLDPQIIIDHENEIEFATADAEWGFMIAPKQGISGYVRPGIGIGTDRPWDWNFEFALKYVWR